MKFNRIMKIAIVMVLVAIITMFASQVVMAYNTDTTVTSMFMNKTDESGASKAAGNIIGMIINIAQVIGTGVAIIILVVFAIKYISAAPEGKAEIKKNATLYIVGAIILFAASGILSIVRRFAVKSINDDIDTTDG